MTYPTEYNLRPALLQFFNNTNVTTDTGMSDEMKTYYSDYLIDIASAKLVHDQFGQRHPIPKNGGQIIEFRKYSPLPKNLGVLVEGVTPDGQKLHMSVITSKVRQYGGYVELSDLLILTAIDNNLVEATKLIGRQAGATLDTITREVLNGGTNVQFAEGQVTSREALTPDHKLTVKAIKMAVRYLKNQNAQKIGDSFVAIIHPDISFDLTEDPAWQNVKTYSDPDDIYEGEIGKLHGVRFVETTEAKIFKASNFTAAATQLTAKAAVENGTVIIVSEAITSDEAFKIPGKQVLINGSTYTIIRCGAGAAGLATIEVDEPVTLDTGAAITSVGGTADGRAVYSTLVIADDAYGVTEITGGGLQHITKQLGSAGTADPLNQRATVGWKATKTAERLVEQYMVRIETCSEFDADAN